MYKKSVARSRIVKLILILIFLVLALIVLQVVFNWTSVKSRDSICWFSVGLKDFTQVGSFSVIREKCPQNRIVVYKSKITKNGVPIASKILKGKNTKIVYDFDSINPSGVIPEDFFYKVLADEMVSCWQKFGAGSEIFEGDFWKGRKNCARCAHVTFDASIANKGIVFSNFYNYLVNNDVPGKDESYHDYLHLQILLNKPTLNTFLFMKAPMTEKEMNDMVEKADYYNEVQDHLRMDQDTAIVASTIKSYDLLYFIWANPAPYQFVADLNLMDLNVRAQVFFIPTDAMNTFLCEAIMN